MQYILVFLSMIFVDYRWGIYMKAMANHEALKASVAGALIMLAGAFTAIGYIEDHYLLIPAVLGGFIGTYVAASKKEK